MNTLLYIVCGMLAGLLGGYLGVGGGIVIVPFLTLVMGHDIKAAVPVSMAAIVINSLAASSEYMKKGMVDLELMVTLTFAMVLGMVAGSTLLTIVPSAYVKVLLAGVLVYTAISLLTGQEKSAIQIAENKKARILYCAFLAFLGGILAGLVGIGGGVIVIPLMFLVIGIPLATARGTSSFIVGFSGAASLAVYFLNGLLNLLVVPGVLLGTIIGGKVGGRLGTVAKPKAVKLLFFALLCYTAFRLAYGAWGELR